MKRRVLNGGLGVLILLLSGCTYQAWFEGFKQRQRQECFKQVNNDDIQNCIDEVNRLTYEEYKQSRRGKTD